MASRREVLVGGVAILAGCAKRADFCEESQIREDGDWPEDCQLTADDIEGPYYLAEAPEREDLDLWGDDGTPITISGTVYESGCAAGVAGAIVEIWHAGPSGKYDDSDELRYRTALITDSEGRYSLNTLIPGRYLNGTAYRPMHIHVKVWIDGAERLTTQLYFQGDEYLDCDPFAATSLVMPLSGDDSGKSAEGIDLVV